MGSPSNKRARWIKDPSSEACFSISLSLPSSAQPPYTPALIQLWAATRAEPLATRVFMTCWERHTMTASAQQIKNMEDLCTDFPYPLLSLRDSPARQGEAHCGKILIDNKKAGQCPVSHVTPRLACERR
jgi:hypothetical protein